MFSLWIELGYLALAELRWMPSQALELGVLASMIILKDVFNKPQFLVQAT